MTQPRSARDAATDVLLVSRDEDVRTIFAAVLRHRGYQVRVLDDPDRALAATVAARPGLIITSFPTALAGGGTVTEALRGDPRCAHVPILNVTGRFSTADLEAAHAAGVSATLPIPVGLMTLLDEVARLLDRAPPPPSS